MALPLLHELLEVLTTLKPITHFIPFDLYLSIFYISSDVSKAGGHHAVAVVCGGTNHHNPVRGVTSGTNIPMITELSKNHHIFTVLSFFSNSRI